MFKRNSLLYLFLGGTILMLISFTWYSNQSESNEPPPSPTVVSLPENIAKDSSAYDIMMDVLTHKRCVNCHPSGNRPRQGEDSHLHLYGVRRGKEGRGTSAIRCTSCHQKENNEFSGVPGAPDWHLAPIEMAWEGLTRNQIARSILDQKINGGRDLQALEKHLTEHQLVLWAFDPGVDIDGNEREKPPISKEDYIAAVKAWIKAGAIVPKD